jgi:AcrR family transcriptional regulator
VVGVVSPSPSRPKPASPNQQAKRQQIIEAAQDVLVRDGLAGCTARAVADASPLTKSAIHYYFDDMDEVVDAAMASHVNDCLARTRAAAEAHDRPPDRFWAAVQAYLEIFAERPNAALLWFSYWVEVGHKQRLEPIDRMHRQVTALLADLLADIPVDDPPARARALFSYLLGTLVQQAVRPVPFTQLQPEIAAVCRLDTPAR